MPVQQEQYNRAWVLEAQAQFLHALRMIEQGGVRVNGSKVSDKGLRLSAGATYVLQVGKRKFAKVALRRAA